MVSTSPRSRSSARIGSANGTGAWKYFPNEYTSRLPSGDAIGRTILAGSVGSTSTRFRSPVNDTSMRLDPDARSEEHTSELQSLMRISYAVFCLKKKKTHK